jgi:hypothetical protein
MTNDIRMQLMCSIYISAYRLSVSNNVLRISVPIIGQQSSTRLVAAKWYVWVPPRLCNWNVDPGVWISHLQNVNTWHNKRRILTDGLRNCCKKWTPAESTSVEPTKTADSQEAVKLEKENRTKRNKMG